MALIYADQVAATIKLFDGLTYLGARNGPVADTVYATNIGQRVGQLKIGGGGGWAVFRSVLIFTIPAGLPDFDYAKLILHNEAGTAFYTPQYLYCVDAEGEVADTGVVAADYGDLVNNATEWGKYHSSLFVNNTDFQIVLNALARAHIVAEKGSKAIFAFRAEDDINATPPAEGANNYVIYAGSSDVSPTQRPRLFTGSGLTSCQPVMF